MAAQMTFKRYELKYLLTPAQKQAVLRGIEPFMELDRYGRTTIAGTSPSARRCSAARFCPAS